LKRLAIHFHLRSVRLRAEPVAATVSLENAENKVEIFNSDTLAIKTDKYQITIPADAVSFINVVTIAGGDSWIYDFSDDTLKNKH